MSGKPKRGKKRPLAATGVPVITDLKEINDAMSTNGFYIYKGFVQAPSPGVVEILKENIRKRKNTHAIFNGGQSASSDLPERFGDQKRKQLFFNESRKWPSEIDEIIDRVKSTGVVPKREASDHVFLLSEPGCSEQNCHTDANPVVKTDDGVCCGYPLGALVALEPGTVINVWPGAFDIESDGFDTTLVRERVQLVIEPGDLFLFRVDLVHSGASYSTSNVRIHFFLDRSDVAREPNKTYELDPNAFPGIVPDTQRVTN